MTRLLRDEFWNKSFEEIIAHTLDIPRKLHQKEIITVQNLWCFKRRMFMKLLGTKSWGFLGQQT
jgi:hypothetical protein